MSTLPAVRPLARLTAAAALMGLAACKGFVGIDASFQNITRSDTVYALNGGPPASPNAFKFFDGFTSRADQGFAYDVAFDLDGAGNVVIIPSRALATTFSSPYSVALQQVNANFATVLEAPEGGYRPDTAMVVPVGQTVVAESRDFQGVCAFSLKGQSYFSKLVVTEVDPTLRRIVFTSTINRNCGFRSFAPGVPEF